MLMQLCKMSLENRLKTLSKLFDDGSDQLGTAAAVAVAFALNLSDEIEDRLCKTTGR